VIPEIEIWRVANLMLNRYGDEAVAESAKRANELAADADLAGVAARHRRNKATRDHDTARAGTLERRSRGRGGGFAPDAVRSRVEFLECQIRGEEPVIVGFDEPEPLP
jgi:hypothetical protein